MLVARLEDLALALCHGILDLDNITGLRSTRIQSKLRRSPVSQLLTIPLCSVHNEHSGLLVQIRECLFKLPSPTVRREIETLDPRINRPSSTVNDEFFPLQKNSSRASRNLEAHHEHSVLLLRSHILHVKHRRPSLEHPRGRNDHTRSLRSSTPIIPAVNPVRHLTRTLENPRITQSSRMLQEQLHSVESHSIDEDRMFEMVRRQHAEQLLRSANSKGRHRHGPATLHDLRNFLDNLFL